MLGMVTAAAHSHTIFFTSPAFTFGQLLAGSRRCETSHNSILTPQLQKRNLNNYYFQDLSDMWWHGSSEWDGNEVIHSDDKIHTRNAWHLVKCPNT